MRIFNNVSLDRLFFALFVAVLFPELALSQTANQSPGDAGSQTQTPRASLQASRPSLPRPGTEVPEIEPVERATPYRSIPSLRDLYRQYPDLNRKLARFGSDFFANGTQDVLNTSDLSAGPDYILGVGDQLDVDLWGSVNHHLSLKIERDGKITLPEIGSVPVAGRSMGDAQRFVESSLGQQLRKIGVNLALARIRTVRVYVVGDVVGREHMTSAPCRRL